MTYFQESYNALLRYRNRVVNGFVDKLEEKIWKDLFDNIDNLVGRTYYLQIIQGNENQVFIKLFDVDWCLPYLSWEITNSEKEEWSLHTKLFYAEEVIKRFDGGISKQISALIVL